jgi:hypothetical protein
MHAYASDDPVFRAMNRRGQRETDGGLGGFCVNCHAPMAVREGATTDGLNLDGVPQGLRGVTCFFCHTVDAVQGAHDDPLHLADDGVMRASYGDPVAGAPHGAAYSNLHDRAQLASASLCGACHDVRTGHGADLERTFAEWQQSAFAQPEGATCGACHMAQSTAPEAIAQVAGAPLRRAHAHAFAAVDARLDDDPSRATQLQLIAGFLESALQGAVCVEQLGNRAQVKVILDNVAGGHGFPSGSAQDRRVWVQLEASADGGVFYASGAVPDGGSVTALADPDLWLVRDCMFDADGGPTRDFWDAASTEGNALPALATFDASDPRYFASHVARAYPAAGALPAVPDRVEVRVRLQPVGVDVLDDLVATGDLDPSVRARMPTFDVGAPLVWTAAAANQTLLDARTGGVYLCASPQGLNVNAATVEAADARCGL